MRSGGSARLHQDNSAILGFVSVAIAIVAVCFFGWYASGVVAEAKANRPVKLPPGYVCEPTADYKALICKHPTLPPTPVK